MLETFFKKLDELECKMSVRIIFAVILGLVVGNLTWTFIEPGVIQSITKPVVIYTDARIISDPPYNPGDTITIQYSMEKRINCPVVTVPFWISLDNEVIHRSSTISGDYVDSGFQQQLVSIKIPTFMDESYKKIGYSSLQTYDCGRGNISSVYTPTIWVDLTGNGKSTTGYNLTP